MARKIAGLILQLPMLLLMIGSFIAGLYAAYNNLEGVGWSASIIIGVTLVLYFIGLWFLIKSDDSINEREEME